VVLRGVDPSGEGIVLMSRRPEGAVRKGDQDKDLAVHLFLGSKEKKEKAGLLHVTSDYTLKGVDAEGKA